MHAAPDKKKISEFELKHELTFKPENRPQHQIFI